MAKVRKITCILRSDGRHQLAAIRDRHAAVGNKADTIVCKNWTARMKSARYRHKDTTPPFAQWGQGRHGRNPHLSSTLYKVELRRH